MSLSKMQSIFCILLVSLASHSGHSQENPASNKLKGVIELGSEGFNSFVINIDQNKDWKLIKSQFGKSYLMESSATESSVKAGLEKHIDEITSSGVAAKDIHFVISSGAADQTSTSSIITGIEELGYVVNVVSAEKEGQLAFKSVLPDSQKSESIVIDIGSSNTKISWFENEEIVSISTYGSKYFVKNITDEEVLDDLKNITQQLPTNKSSKVYLIGGMPYKFAKQTRTGNERYTTLSSLEEYEPKDEKERCGRLILKKLRDGSQIEQFVFDWDSNFSIGFLLELPY